MGYLKIFIKMKEEEKMSTLVTKKAPNFKAPAVFGDNSIKDLELSSYAGKYVVLFFYPLDFTFVCPSEIIAFDKKLDKFKEKNAEVIGVSVDSQFTHYAWKNTPLENGGIGNVRYPLVADLNKNISRDFGVLLDESVALRGLFLIDKEGIVRHSLVNDLPLGRNVDEALRMLDALQFTEQHGEVCPANWQEGEEAMKPTAQGVAEYLAKHGK
jgi:peroxiredoxin (alkyl hydroperoxide reductase subunit C)